MSDTVLAEAEFNRKVRSYWLLSGTIVCIVSIVGIVVLPFWLLLGHWFTERHLQHMRCWLTERSLKVTKGIWVRREATVPLGQITDLQLVEGPIMRWMDLQALKIETAGQSSAGAVVQVVGIVNAREFRDTVLRQRDAIEEGISAGRDRSRTAVAPPPEEKTEGTMTRSPGVVAAGGEAPELLREIRDALLRIETKLKDGRG